MRAAFEASRLEDWAWLAKSLLGSSVRTVSDPLKEDVKRALVIELSRLRVESGQTTPPFHPEEIAPLRRVVEIVDAPIAREAALVPEREGFQLKVRSGLTGHRRRSAIAHEIGHTFFYDLARSPPHHAVATSDRNISTDHEEWLAQRIGREILVPTDVLLSTSELKGAPSIRTFKRLCERFDVSPDIMAWRLLRDLRYWDTMLALVEKRETDLRAPSHSVFKGRSYARTSLDKLFGDNLERLTLWADGGPEPGLAAPGSDAIAEGTYDWGTAEGWLISREPPRAAVLIRSINPLRSRLHRKQRQGLRSSDGPPNPP